MTTKQLERLQQATRKRWSQMDLLNSDLGRPIIVAPAKKSLEKKLDTEQSIPNISSKKLAQLGKEALIERRILETGLINIVTLRAFLMKVEDLAKPSVRFSAHSKGVAYHLNQIDVNAAKWRAKRGLK